MTRTPLRKQAVAASLSIVLVMSMITGFVGLTTGVVAAANGGISTVQFTDAVDNDGDGYNSNFNISIQADTRIGGDFTGPGDPYFIIKADGQTVKTTVQKRRKADSFTVTVDPSNLGSQRQTLDIVVELWDDDRFDDDRIARWDPSSADLNFEPFSEDLSIRDKSSHIISGLNSSYEKFSSRLLNADWWDKQATEQARQAATSVDLVGELQSEAIGKLLPGVTGAVYSKTSTAQSIYTIARQIGFLVGATRSDVIASQMRNADGYQEARNGISDLQENAQAIERAKTASERKEAYRQRKQILEDLYANLVDYTWAVYSDVDSNPIWDTGFIGSYYGTNAYSSIRGNIEALRQYLVADYFATTAYLNNEKSNQHLARSSRQNMPTHRLDFAQSVANQYDTLETSNDYALYKVTIDDELAGDKLVLGLQGPQTDGIEAYFSNNKPDVDSPIGTQFGDDAEFVKQNILKGTYYVLVKPDSRTGPYQFTAKVKSGLFDFGQAPEVNAINSNQIGHFPAPEITDISISSGAEVTKRNEMIIDVTVENRGGNADWQSIGISLPKVADETDVETVSHSLDYVNIYGPGFEAGAEYGTTETSLDYVLVEGAAREWESGEKHLRIQISPEETGSFPVLVKSVARGFGNWESDPGVGETEITDQQHEFVERRTIDVVSPTTSTTETPTTTSTTETPTTTSTTETPTTTSTTETPTTTSTTEQPPTTTTETSTTRTDTTTEQPSTTTEEPPTSTPETSTASTTTTEQPSTTTEQQSTTTTETSTTTTEQPSTSKPSAGVHLSPAEQSIGLSETTTFDVVVEDAIDDGVGAAEITLTLDDPSIASITNVDVKIDREKPDKLTDIDYRDNNSTAKIDFASSLSDAGRVTLATVTVEAERPGSSDVSLSVDALGDEEGDSYEITTTRGASLTVESPPKPLNSYEGQPQDFDGDGLYEDVNGDGEFNVVDVQALFANLDNPKVRNNSEAFDFNQQVNPQTGNLLSVVDVQALFVDVINGSDDSERSPSASLSPKNKNFSALAKPAADG